MNSCPRHALSAPQTGCRIQGAIGIHSAPGPTAAFATAWMSVTGESEPLEPPEIKAHTPAPRTPQRQASGQASAAASRMAWHPKPAVVLVTGAGKLGYPPPPRSTAD